MRQPDTIDIGSVIETQASSWYSHLVVILCCVAMVIEGYDAQVLAYAAPAIIRDWNIEQSYFGPVFGAALFGYMLGATLLTGVSDKIGRKKVIVLGNVFFGLLTVASHSRRTSTFYLQCVFLPDWGSAPQSHLRLRLPWNMPPASSSIPSEHPIYRLHAGCGTWRRDSPRR